MHAPVIAAVRVPPGLARFVMAIAFAVFVSRFVPVPLIALFVAMAVVPVMGHGGRATKGKRKRDGNRKAKRHLVCIFLQNPA